MRRVVTLPMLCAVAFLAACNSEPTSVTTPDIPTAGVRFIHAVPDTGALDLRFVDIPENSSHYGMVFRGNIVTSANIPASTQIEYKNTRAGSRHLRIFLNSTVQAIASTIIKDTTITLEAGKLYTLLLSGYANPTGAGRPASAPAMTFRVIEESVADASPNVSLRVANLGMTALDVRAYRKGAAVPATPTWTNVAGLTLSTYATAAPDTMQFNVRASGGANLIATDFIALRGQEAVVGPPGPFDAIPGTTVAGSALTALVFPPSVPGTAAPQGTAFNSSAISFVWDRRPPRPAGV